MLYISSILRTAFCITSGFSHLYIVQGLPSRTKGKCKVLIHNLPTYHHTTKV